MNNIKRHVILIILIICSSISSCTNQTNISPSSTTQDTTNVPSKSYKDTSIKGIMVNTAKFMQYRKSDVNNDRNFAALMIYFNHAALNMSDILLSKGKNVALIKFAKESIARRKYVIKEMDLFLQEEPDEKSFSSNDFQKSVNVAASEIRSASVFQVNDIDNLYIQSMILFNQAAINIADAELKYGSHQTLKNHARNILSDERDQLQKFQSWLNNSVK